MNNKSTFDANLIDKWLEHNFPILINKVESDEQNKNLESTRESLTMFPFNFCLQSLVMPKIEEYVRRLIVPNFWSNFTNKTACNEKQSFHNFTNSVSELYTQSSRLIPMLKKIELVGSCKDEYCIYSQVNILDYFKLVIRGTLLSQIPLYHTVIIEHFYKTAFNVFCNIEASISDQLHSNLMVLCEGCEQEQNNCNCQLIVNIFHETNKKLIELDLLERLIGNVLTSLIHIRIESHITLICNQTFQSSQLESLETWLDTVVMNWLIRIYSGGSSRSVSLNYKVRTAINTFKQKLNYFLYETYTRLRIDQLFNIIIEYPDSCPAINDLRICLKRTNLRKYLIRSLQEALKVRLLHPGVSTPDILTAYIAAIKALRQLDSTGVLLETITAPIKIYLRKREDTVRCVVCGLLDESSTSDLADELAKGGDTIELDADEASPPEDKEDWENWQPDPIDTDSTNFIYTIQRSRKVSDIISMLVNVYGSQDLFVNEYRTLLADRLLSQLDYQTDREVHHLELLKRRFGEHQLHYCEVMIKDIYDSKKINENIQVDKNYNNKQANFATMALILSAQFWPPFKEDWKLELPNFVQKQLDKYVKAYETIKGSRTLCWKPHLGNVNLDIETKDRKLNFNVSPIHATIITYFQNKIEWNLDQLSDLMHVPTTVLKRKISYWVSQGLLNEINRDTFVLLEETSGTVSKNLHLKLSSMLDDEEVESAMASANDQREEKLQVFWSYIVGMLTNLDSMPLERIHQMLKMFASQGSGTVECGLPELKLFLDKKVREHQLLFSGGFYKLPKI